MLMKRARVYSSSCSQVVLVYLYPFRRKKKLPKNHETPPFRVQDHSRSSTLTFLRSSSPVLVMISSMSVCAHLQPFLHARASIAIARISYGNSVCPSVTTRYQSKTTWDRDFGVSPHDSLESLVFRYKISCRWVKGTSRTMGRKKGTPPPKDVILPL